MKNSLRKYIQESLRLFLFKNGTLDGCESAIQNEVSTLTGASIAGHVGGRSTAAEEDLEDELQAASDSAASSFGGGSYAG